MGMPEAKMNGLVWYSNVVSVSNRGAEFEWRPVYLSGIQVIKLVLPVSINFFTLT